MTELEKQIEDLQNGIMEPNRRSTLDKFEKYKGQLVITAEWKVERFVAIGEDEWDFLYITFDGRVVHEQVINARLIPLKGFIKDDDYDSMIRQVTLNHYDFYADKEVVIEMIKNELNSNITLMSEICLDLN